MVMGIARPGTIAELSEVVRCSAALRLEGHGASEAYRLPTTAREEDLTRLELQDLSGIVEFSPDDQVVVARAGTQIQDLQRELGPHGQCLPIVEWLDGYSHLMAGGHTLALEIGMNLPEYLEAECGSWRDWIIGITVVRADGTVAKAGSKAVKNVAGYDLHRFAVGSRGALFVIAEVSLRTFPVRSLPKPEVRRISTKPSGRCAWVQRTKPVDFHAACAGASGFAGFDVVRSNTLWRFLPEGVELSRYPDDWVLRSNCGKRNLELRDPVQARLMQRAKSVFDPTGKLNPGEMGDF